MNDLPDPSGGTVNNLSAATITSKTDHPPTVNQPSLDTDSPGITLASGGLNKEVERGAFPSEEPAVSLKDIGFGEIELSKEVSAAGVRVRPTTVPIPPSVGQLGVTQAGTRPIQQAATTALPLSDDQIAQGLHQSVASSWRWLAEWCQRRLKQMRQTIKQVHGRMTRVQL